MAAEYTINDFRKMLRINKHRLDDELELQAELMYWISEHLVKITSQTAHLKNELEKLDAVIISELKESGQKGAANLLAGKAKEDPERESTWMRYQVSLADQMKWEYMLEAWRSRGFALTGLGNLYSANYFSPTSVGSTSTKESSQESYEQLRERISEKRTSSDSKSRRKVLF